MSSPGPAGATTSSGAPAPDAPPRRAASRARSLAARVAGLCALAYLALLVPERKPVLPAAAHDPGARPFAWNQDAFWVALEDAYARARAAGCDALAPGVGSATRALEERLERLRGGSFAPDAAIFGELERLVFDLGPPVAGCPRLLPAYVDLVARVREAAKRQSERWPPGDRRGREALYRLLHGGRAAVEEVVLQVSPGAGPPPLIRGVDEPSATPAATLLGVELHSGDVLLSRGGAATSALIARGSDFPGNFSHVALVHVDAATRRVRLVEAHIERGVTISTALEYLRDPKLRVMVLRLRADLPSVARDPLLPHRAAEAALARARTRPIDYDFAMDAGDPSRLFCSEVAADAYRRHGVTLWMGPSRISSPGVQRWLAGFGVRHFETLEPSDLEYDPQLRVVAEWRDADGLRKDHLDDAATEAMLDAATAGATLRHDRWLLPLARVTKAYSVVQNALGRVGPVPRGMSATAALRSRWYEALHADVRARLDARAEAYRAANGYAPPYWRLVRMAAEELRAMGALAPQT